MGDRLSNDMRAGGGGSNGEEESEPISEAEGQALADGSKRSVTSSVRV